VETVANAERLIKDGIVYGVQKMGDATVWTVDHLLVPIVETITNAEVLGKEGVMYLAEKIGEVLILTKDYLVMPMVYVMSNGLIWACNEASTVVIESIKQGVAAGFEWTHHQWQTAVHEGKVQCEHLHDWTQEYIVQPAYNLLHDGQKTAKDKATEISDWIASLSGYGDPVG
jgi:hypothetical protein